MLICLHGDGPRWWRRCLKLALAQLIEPGHLGEELLLKVVHAETRIVHIQCVLWYWNLKQRSPFDGGAEDYWEAR
jgi:hypothetical protein